MVSGQKYWFPAKRYGWGWGLPNRWQGWVTLTVFVALIAAGAFMFPPRENIAAYLIYVAITCAAFVFVCWWKGEPPHWRWGGD